MLVDLKKKSWKLMFWPSTYRSSHGRVFGQTDDLIIWTPAVSACCTGDNATAVGQQVVVSHPKVVQRSPYEVKITVKITVKIMDNILVKIMVKIM